MKEQFWSSYQEIVRLATHMPTGAALEKFFARYPDAAARLDPLGHPANFDQRYLPSGRHVHIEVAR